MAAQPEFLNENIEIELASLLGSNGTSIDVRYSITDLVIQENIFSYCMNGSVSIMDGLGLIDKLPIIGDELFTIRFRSPESGNIFVTKTFFVYSVYNRTKVDDKLEHYTLGLISIEGMIDSLTNIDINFVGKTYSEIVKNIFDSYVLKSNIKFRGVRLIDYPKFKKTLSADSTDGLQSITVNGERPFDFIQRCVDNSRSTEYPDSDFVFYEDRDEFVFTPISYLLEQDVVETFIMGDHGIEERTLNKVANNTRYVTISQIEYTGGNDVIRGTSGGKFGNRIDVIDPITKRFKSIVNNYLNIQKSKDKFKTLDRNNIIIDESIFKEDTGQSNKQYHVARLFNDTYQEIEYIKNRITEKNDRFIFHADTAYKSYGRKAMKFNLLDNTTLTIAVPGNSNLLCGKTVNVNIPISSSLEEDKMNPYSHLFGNKENNKFLITSLTHNFIGNEGRYFTYLTLAKDSYFVDVNKKYSGRYK